MLTVQCINEIDDIISHLNAVSSDDERKRTLAECVADPDLFIKVMGKYRSAKPKKRRDTSDMFARTDNSRNTESGKYNNDAVLDEFMHTNAAQLKDKYSLNELKNIYEALYERRPSSGYTKERIIDTVRNMAFAVARAKAFGEMAEKRQMRCNASKAVKEGAQC